MELKRRGCKRGSDGPLDGFCDGLGFGRTGGEQNYFFGFEDGSDPHGNGAAGNLFAGSEGLAIVFEGFSIQDFQARSRGEARGRLVEPDMAVAPDAQNLQINSSGSADGLLIRGAIFFVITADFSVGDMRVR